MIKNYLTIFIILLSQRLASDIDISCDKAVKVFEDEYECLEITDMKIGEPHVRIAFLVKKNDTKEKMVLKVSRIDFDDKFSIPVNILDKVYGLQYVIKRYDVKNEDSYLYEILEYASNGSLTRYMEKFNFMGDQKKILELFYKITKGVASIHNAGIVHANLKPDNILIMENGEPRIINFEFSVLMNDYTTKRGTPAYMAPEILTQKNDLGFKYTGKVDLWSLGIIFYKMLYKKHPFLFEEDRNEVSINMHEYTIYKDTFYGICDLLLTLFDFGNDDRLTILELINHIENDLNFYDYEDNRNRIKKDDIMNWGPKDKFYLNFKNMRVDIDSTYRQYDLSENFPNIKGGVLDDSDIVDYPSAFRISLTLQIILLSGLTICSFGLLSYYIFKKRNN